MIGRSRFLWGMLTLWALLALGRGAYLAGPLRQSNMALAEKIAGCKGVIPAMRGTLFDRDRIPVAWDEAHLELRATPLWQDHDAATLAAALKRPLVPDESGVILCRLSPVEAEAVEALLRRGFPAKIVVRCERMIALSPARRDFLIALENIHDRQLRGRDGLYRVMLDRHFDEIPGSWQLIEAPVRGTDVILDVSLAEMEGK